MGDRELAFWKAACLPSLSASALVQRTVGMERRGAAASALGRLPGQKARQCWKNKSDGLAWRPPEEDPHVNKATPMAFTPIQYSVGLCLPALEEVATQAQRVRKPRCCTGPQGLLPRYSESQAEGQEQLFKLTDNIQDE
ncbi:hypothetical protein MC885_011588, partial [Smutsia gigantea]